MLLLWVASLWVLVRAETGSGAAEGEALHLDGPAEFHAGEEWQGIYLGGRKVGYLHLRKRKEGDGFAVQDDVVLDLQVMGQRRRVESRLTADLDGDLHLRRFTFRLEGGADARLDIEGEVVGLEVRLVLASAGEVSRRTVTLEEPPVLDFGVKPLLARKGLRGGETFRTHFFDPSILGNREVTIRVVGRERLVVVGQEVEAVVLSQNLGGVELRAWVTPSGEVLKEELPMGLVALREVEEEARSGIDGVPGVARNERDVPDLIRELSVPLLGTLPEGGVDRLDRVRLRLVGLADSSGLDLDGGRQTWRDGILEVRSLEVAPPAGKESLDPAVHAALRPEPLVQSDHPEIVATARSVVGNAVGLPAVRRLVSWVERNLTKTNVVGLPSALEVFRARRGDCNEHATLLLAMLRAVGIPARLDTGLVFLEGRFYYHAWVEAHVEGRWVEVDPTTGQVPADVLHVRLVRGSLERQVEVLRVVHSLRGVEVVSAVDDAGGEGGGP